MMMEDEELLSLDLEDSDYLYRIRKGNRIVYVKVDPKIISLSDRTDGSKVLARLNDIQLWKSTWQTLTVTKTDTDISSQADQFQPHRLSHNDSTFSHKYNILDLKRLQRISDRVSKVKNRQQTCILKIARFKHELPSLSNELRAYNSLRDRHFTHIPDFLGLVYEEVEDRIIGFLLQALEGYHPQLDDLPLCQNALHALHAHDVAHGDLNKFNILIENNKVYFLDFEVSKLRSDKDFENCVKLELDSLSEKLADTSGIGDRGV